MQSCMGSEILYQEFVLGKRNTTLEILCLKEWVIRERILENPERLFSEVFMN